MFAWLKNLLRAGSDERTMSYEEQLARWEGRPTTMVNRTTAVSDDTQARVEYAMSSAADYAVTVARAYGIDNPESYVRSVASAAIAQYVSAYHAWRPGVTRVTAEAPTRNTAERGQDAGDAQ